MGKKSKKAKQPQTPRQEAPPNQPECNKNFWRHHLVPALILLIVPFLLYAYSIQFGYVLDDEIVLSENNFVKKGFAGIWELLSTESFTGYLGEQQDLVVGARYRPLSLITFAIEYALFGLSPHISHFINILLYALTGLLLFRIFSLFLTDAKGQPWWLGMAFLTAFIFVIHPVHTEVVANIKSRDEILTLLLSLLVLYASFKYLLSGKVYWLVFSGILFLPALLAKENAITFMAVIPMTLYFFTNQSLKKIITATAPLLITAVIYIFIRYTVIGYLLDSGKEVTGLMNNPFLGASNSETFATITYTLALYIKLLFFPHPLTHDYYPYQIPVIEWSDPRAFLSLLFYTGLLVYAIRGIKQKKIASYGILFFVATISIVSNFLFPVGVFMAERFLFMPSVGFCLLIAYWLSGGISGWIKSPHTARSVSAILLLVITAGFSAKTLLRVPDWKDALSLNKSGAMVSTGSARAQQFYGYTLYRAGVDATDREQKKKYFDQATPYVDRALAIHPTYPDALRTKAGLLGGYYQLDGDLDKLLNGFYRIQLTRLTPFVDTYLDYLQGRADVAKLRNFYQQLGKALQQKGNTAKANYYLERTKKISK